MAQTTNINVIQSGIVRNLQKTPFYLRIPAEPASVKGRTSRTIKIPATSDIELDYTSWKLVENDLIINHNLGILLIIRYPSYSAPAAALLVINNYSELPTNPADGTIVWVQYGTYQGIFFYDRIRNEWLSENETTLTWSSSTDSTAQSVNLVSNSDDTRRDNDYTIKNPITITGMAASQANALEIGNHTRFELNTYNLNTDVINTNVASIDLAAVGERGAKNTSLNVPLPEEIIISATRTKQLGSAAIKRPALTVWYRERLLA